jgi:hypothetical protein
MALKLCLERLLPPRKDRPISLNLPEVKEASDVPMALNALLAAVSQGDITPSEAGILTGLVGTTHKAIISLLPEPEKWSLPEEAYRDPEARMAILKYMQVIRKYKKIPPAI